MRQNVNWNIIYFLFLFFIAKKLSTIYKLFSWSLVHNLFETQKLRESKFKL